MSLFMLNKYNLADVENVPKARKNLGLGTLALQDSNEVSINGGNIVAENLQLKNTYNNVDIKDGFFMVSDEYGNAYWKEFNSTRENCNIKLTGFCNDAPFITKSDLNTYVNSQCNLSDLSDIQEALKNLQIDHLLEPDINEPTTWRDLYNARASKLRVSNLTVKETFEIKQNLQLHYLDDTSLSENNILQVDVNNCNNIVVANLANNITDAYPNIPPSAYLLNSIYTQLSNNQFAAFSNLDAKLNRINNGSNYLEQLNNLSDLSNTIEAISNLGLGNISFENNVFKTSNLFIADNLQFKNASTTGNVLTCDNFGNASWDYLPQATTTIPGIVKLSHERLISEYEQEIVPSMDAMMKLYDDIVGNIPKNVTAFSNDALYLKKSNFFSEFNNITTTARYNLLSNLNIFTCNIVNFPENISRFSNDAHYLKLEDKLQGFEFDDLKEVYSNLRLADVALYGDYSNLTNTPSHLLKTNLDGTYLSKSNNLEDLENKTSARSNLGLGDISTLDRDGIEITGGLITNLTSIETKEFILTNDTNIPNFDTLSNITFLNAINPTGTGDWKQLPDASVTQKGIVKFVRELSESSSDTVFNSESISNIYNIIGSNIKSNIDAVKQIITNTSGNIDFLNITNILSVGGKIYSKDDINASSDINVRSNLNVEGTATFTGVLNGQQAIIDNINTDNLTVTNNLSVSGNAFYRNELSVNGLLTAKNGIEATGGEVLIHNTLSINREIYANNGIHVESGDIRGNGNLSISGHTYAISGFTVSSLFTSKHSAKFQGNTTFEGTFDAQNGINVSSGDVILGDNLSVENSIIIRNTLSVGKKLVANNGINVTQGDVEIKNTISVNGDIVGNNGINITSGDVRLNALLSVGGHLYSKSGLTVSGGILNATTGATISGGALNVNGEAFIDSIKIPSTLSVNDNRSDKIIIRSNLSVGETSYFKDVDIQGDLIPNVNNTYNIGSIDYMWSNLHVNNMYYNNYDALKGVDKERQLLTMSKTTGVAEWIGINDAMCNVTLTNVLSNVAIFCDIITIANDIVYNANHSQTEADVKANSILVSDTIGTMYWNSNVKVSSNNNGFDFNDQITMIHENGMLILGTFSNDENGSKVVVKKHIFR